MATRSDDELLTTDEETEENDLDEVEDAFEAEVDEVDDSDDSDDESSDGCVLLRREALEASGGFEALHDALIDDCTLASRVKAAGYKGLLIVIDEAGIVESANPATERLFGYATEEIVGSNIKMLMPEPFRSEHDGYLARFLDTGERRMIGDQRELEGRRKDGTTFPMELSVSEMLIEPPKVKLEKPTGST